jgi:hypothetical protein
MLSVEPKDKSVPVPVHLSLRLNLAPLNELGRSMSLLRAVTRFTLLFMIHPSPVMF